MTNWTRKHNKFSVQNRLTPTARELWQWLLDELPSGSNEIIDLREFNKWVNRTRGFPHDPKTVKSAAKQLRDKGVLTHAKSYTAYVWKCTLQSIRVLMPPVSLPQQKNSAFQLLVPGLEASNPQSVVNQVLTTTTGLLDDSRALDLEEKLEACRTAGIYYHPKDANFLRNFSLQEVLKAIVYFLFNRDTVRKPEGWFRVCLEDNWAGKEDERHQLREQWSAQGLFEAIRYCNQKMGRVLQQE
jgi:hypothetical protein